MAFELDERIKKVAENCTECCICLESFILPDDDPHAKDVSSHIILKECGHKLHKQCLTLHLRSSSHCPLCRADINLSENGVEVLVRSPPAFHNQRLPPRRLRAMRRQASEFAVSFPPMMPLENTFMPPPPPPPPPVSRSWSVGRLIMVEGQLVMRFLPLPPDEIPLIYFPPPDY